MKEKNKKLFLLFYLFSLLFTVKAQSPANDLNWNTIDLKFSDDFNTVNTSIWEEWNSEHPLWPDFCFNTNKISINSTILTGNNVLELKAENDHQCENGLNGKPISSGAIQQRTPYLYGYYEAYCKFASTGPTYMPAFWLYEGNCSAGWYDEIDVEIFSNQSPSLFDYTTNIHYKRETPSDCNSPDAENAFLKYTPNPSLNLAFHKYGIEWTPNQIVFYYDDIPIRIKNNFVPDHAMDITFDLGFRGVTSNTNNDFPGYMYVDYVKVYDLLIDCGNNADLPDQTAFNNFIFKVKGNISIGNSSNTITFNTGTHKTFRASGNVTINGNFEVSGNSELTILPTVCY